MEKPILFSGEMVKAILDGRKTQTRRVMKPQPLFYTGRKYIVPDDAPKKWHDCDDIFAAGFCPYGQPDDILYVRETWADLRGMGFGNDPQTDNPWNFAYAADIKPGSDSDRIRKEYGVKWKPNIHMPREAARLFLRVKSVRVERVQDISEDDARAEGCSAGYETHGDGKFEDVTEYEWTAKEEFADLWNSIYAKRGFGWDINPWVWVVEFDCEVVE